MTGRGNILRERAAASARGTYSSDDMERMQGAIDAVCGELGISAGPEREDVARRVIAAYETGRRLPLNLVDAGLGAH